jgi:hypothetical protein
VVERKGQLFEVSGAGHEFLFGNRDARGLAPRARFDRHDFGNDEPREFPMPLRLPHFLNEFARRFAHLACLIVGR